MQESFWWWQCINRYIISFFSHLCTHFPPFSLSLISLMVSVDVKHHAYLLGIKHQVTYFRSLFSCSHFSFSATFPFFPLAQIHSHSSTCSVTQFIPVVYSPSSSLWFILPLHPSGLFSQFIPLVYPPSPPLWFILPFLPASHWSVSVHPPMFLFTAYWSKGCCRSLYVNNNNNILYSSQLEIACSWSYIIFFTSSSSFDFFFYKPETERSQQWNFE